ncbi:MAG: glycine cleavage system protein GcvH [Amphritea sp.]|uniref:glycine cleavage system protein GcvH n=1 Tax=Amphritea sp. TaxID=1872502 RepID=UPI001B564D68|nr:glycine cleavage system protein GcvH [Amphritea sp.]MBQ0756508.1 glycine cleavage system protein GcvH [Amphritea sp.]MBQ0785531.1 glycine cleavage system protein GcvH [Amphritea sp.]
MSDIPSDLKYVASHEWIRDEGDGVVAIGVTDHAQDLLGDVVFVELPDVGADFAVGDDIGVVESVKAASDIYAPLSGQIVAVNEELEDSPELVNSDPYGDGWFIKIRLSEASETAGLLDADGYAELCEAES